MKNFYTLLFPKASPIYAEPISEIPEWCSYCFSQDTPSLQYLYSASQIITQTLVTESFRIDLLQAKTIGVTEVKFQFEGEKIIFAFVLKGNFKIRHKKIGMIPLIQQQLYLFQNHTGTYHAKFQTGYQILVVVNIKKTWFDSVLEINDFYSSLYHSPGKLKKLPGCLINQQLRSWLQKIYNFNGQNPSALEGLLRMYLAFILEYYVKEIQNKRRALIYKVKAYIDEHYTDENLTPEFLTKLFGISSRSLRYQFKKEFSQAVSTYYTKLRMLEAEKLIHDLKIPICDVYMTLGYQNESTFRYHYANFLKLKGPT